MKRDDERNDETDRRIASYLSGELSGEEAARLEHEILEDDELAERLYSEINLRAATERPADDEAGGATPIDRTARRTGRPFRWRSLLLPVAAGLLVGLFGPQLKRMMTGGDGDVYRGATAPAGAISPMGDLSAPPERFVWHAAPGAASYRFTLLDSEIRPVHQAVVRDTFLVLPPSEAPWERGPDWVWRVVPLDGMSAEMDAAPPATFHVTGQGDRAGRPAD